ncbi:MAG: hypothetical protein AB9869_22430 [Verrucomicrobiia bacterium]
MQQADSEVERKREDRWNEYLSPLKLGLLAVNGLCFGDLLVLLVLGKSTGEVVVLTIGTGLSFGALLTGAIIAARRRSSHRSGSLAQHEIIS